MWEDILRMIVGTSERPPDDLKYNLLNLLFWGVIMGVAFGLLMIFG